MGLGLFQSFGDFFSSLRDLAEDQANERINGRFSGDHIAAQNAAFYELKAALDMWDSTKPHNMTEWAAFNDEVLGIANTFVRYASTFGTARANRGAQEILALAKQITYDAKQDVITGAGSIGGAVGLPQISNTMVYGGLALGALYLLSRRRR